MNANSTPSARSNAANQSGSFHFSPLKNPLSLEQQVQLMIDRGLHIQDTEAAMRWLAETNYYRVRGYWLTLERNGSFIPGTSLNDIQEIYMLDNDLRQWLWNAITPIEIKARTALAYHLSMACGPMAYADATHFIRQSAHSKSIHQINDECTRALRNGVPCVQHNMEKYGVLPLWAAVEIMTMGTTSSLYGNLADGTAYNDGTSVKNAIASDFGTKPYYLKSWLQHLTYIRNLCGHHDRIYNRTITTRARMLHTDNQFSSQKIFPTIIILKRIYERSWTAQWQIRSHTLINIINAHNSVDLHPMGFPRNWKSIIEQ